MGTPATAEAEEFQTSVPEPAFEIANLINDNEETSNENTKVEHRPQNRHSWTPGDTRGDRRGGRNRGRRGR